MFDRARGESCSKVGEDSPERQFTRDQVLQLGLRVGEHCLPPLLGELPPMQLEDTLTVLPHSLTSLDGSGARPLLITFDEGLV